MVGDRRITSAAWITLLACCGGLLLLEPHALARRSAGARKPRPSQGAGSAAAQQPTQAAPPLKEPCAPDNHDPAALSAEGWRLYQEALQQQSTGAGPREATRLLERALRCFRTAVGYSKTPGLIYHPMGLTLARLERHPEAYDTLRQYLGEVPEAARKPGITDGVNAKLAELRTRVGELDVDTVAGVEVRVDGQLIGVAPLPRTVAVLPGTHSVVAGDAAQGTSGTEVRVAAGEVRHVALADWRKREAPRAFLSVLSNRAGARILVNALDLGAAPLIDHVLPPGAYQVGLRDGRQAVSQPVSLRADQHLTLTLKLPPRPYVWALVALSSAAVVGGAIALGTYYGTSVGRPDATLPVP